MNNSSKNQSFRPGQREVDSVSKSARAAGRDGAIVGGVGGYVAGGLASRRFRKARLVGAAIGTGAGYVAGKAIGRKAAAKDDIASRRALREMEELLAHVTELTADVRNGNSGFPGASGQHPTRIYPKAKGPYIPGSGIDDQGEYELTEERQRLAELYGRGIVGAFADEDLSEENCRRLHDEVLRRQAKAAGPNASSNVDPEFARAFLGPNAARMTDTEVICHFEAARRNGLVELDSPEATTAFALINRTRNPEGQFADDNQTSSAAVRKAYSPDSVTARAASADPHTGRDATLAGAAVGAAGLAGRAFLKGRKGRLKLPPGVAKIAGSGAPKSFAMTSAPGPGTYPIRRAKLKGKKQPGVPKVKIAGKKKTNLALLIHDDAFPLVPQPGQKLAPGMKRRVPLAKSRADVLKRLKEITALASNFSVGSAVAETLIDAAGLTGVTPTKKKKLVLDRDGNPINPQFLPTPATTSTSSFESALRRLHEFGLGSSIASGAGRFLPEVGAIAGGDLIGESLHDRIVAARQRKAKKARLQVRGGIEAQGPPGPTTLAAILGVVQEFDYGVERTARAKRTGTTIAAAGAGGALGAYAGLRHEPGHVAQPGEIQPGSTVYRRREGFIPTRHYGVVDESGRVAHRTAGSSKIRNVTTDSFRKLGKGRTYVESPRPGDRTPSQIAAAASAAKGTSSGKYSTLGNNCEHATSKLSGGKAVSRQVRRAIGGAAIGATGASTVAHILQNHKKKDQ